ncbi:unnamed protein product [Enterobius vermicularis]|uniref:Serine-type D-Ala-D-Ala carboxypeptidase n=1 Tax=Enterobius vermicularis TaxID=51028 RepID=A0A0N4VAX3_ENTVE|nr:unnamed protein product [Enterobius vermicularis]
MVRILDNGDIVQDDTNASLRSRQSNSPSSSVPTSRTGQNAGQHQGSNFFTTINDRLTEYGVPSFAFYGTQTATDNRAAQVRNLESNGQQFWQASTSKIFSGRGHTLGK